MNCYEPASQPRPASQPISRSDLHLAHLHIHDGRLNGRIMLRTAYFHVVVVDLGSSSPSLFDQTGVCGRRSGHRRHRLTKMWFVVKMVHAQVSGKVADFLGNLCEVYYMVVVEANLELSDSTSTAYPC